MIDLQVARGRSARVGPWRGSGEIGTIVTYLDQQLSADDVAVCVAHLQAAGYTRIVTAALDPTEEPAFMTHGFTGLRRLCLLRRSLDDHVPRGTQSLRRMSRRHAIDVLEIDRVAFEPFWQFNESALTEALNATPHRLLRTDAERPPTGYALSGAARDRGYLQRLAVRPEAAGRGLGTALLLDALRWLQGRGARSAFVNTQHDNERALALYERHGFSKVPGGLVILELEL